MQTDGTGFFACSLLITVLCIFPQWKASQSHGLCDCWCYRFFSEPCLHPFYLEPSCPRWAQQSAPPKDIVLHEPQTVLLWAVTFLDKELRSLSGSSVGASELLLWLRGGFEGVLFGLIYCGITRMWPLYALWFMDIITIQTTSWKPLIGLGILLYHIEPTEPENPAG